MTTTPRDQALTSTICSASSIVDSLELVPSAVRACPRWVPVSGKDPSIGGAGWQRNATTLEEAARHPHATGVGFYLGEDRLGCPSPITIIDFDGVLCPAHADDPEQVAHVHSGARPLLDALLGAGVYVEWSASMLGFHAIVQRMDLPDINKHLLGACAECGRTHYDKGDGKLRPAALEAWGSGNTRQVVITGHVVDVGGYSAASVVLPLPVTAEQILRPIALSRPVSTGKGSGAAPPVPESEAESDEQVACWLRSATDQCSVKIMQAVYHGDLSPWDDDRSAAAFAVALALTGRGGLSAVQCLDVMESIDWVHDAAHSGRTGRSWLWSYVVWRASEQTRVLTAAELFEATGGAFYTDPAPFDFMGSGGSPLALEQEQEQELAREITPASTSNVVRIEDGAPLDITTPPRAGVARSLDGLVYISEKGGYYVDTRTLGVMLPASLSTVSGYSATDLRTLVTNQLLPYAELLTYDPLLPPRAVGYHRRTGAKVFNTYNGLAVAPYAGADAGTEASVRPWLEWVERIIPDPIQREELLNFLAAYVQGIKVHQALVLFGEHGGEGKNFLVNAVIRMFGSAGGHVNVGHMMGDFSGWRHQKQLVCFSEGFASKKYSKMEVAETLKQVVDNASGWYASTLKGKDPVEAPDVLNVVICINNTSSLPLDGTDRKFYPIRAAFTAEELCEAPSLQALRNSRKHQFERFEADWYRSETDQYGLSRLLAFLLARDLKAKGFSAAGATASEELLNDMREASTPPAWQAIEAAAQWAEAAPDVFVLTKETRRDLCLAFYAELTGDRGATLTEGLIASRWGKVCRYGALRSRVGSASFPVKQLLPLEGVGVVSIREYMNGAQKYPRSWEDGLDLLGQASSKVGQAHVEKLAAKTLAPLLLR